jgi:outer membrane lipoprotein carrier protein
MRNFCIHPTARCSFVLFFFFLLFQPLYAADLSTLLNNLHTMRADIVQTIYDNRGKAIETAYGEMALARPGQFRWEIKKPIPQLIIVNQNRVIVYDPDLEQAVMRPLEKKQGEGGALLLSESSAGIEKKYRITPIKADQAGWQWFSLAPYQESNSMMVSIEIGFLHDELQAMRLKDHLGHTTLIQFKNVKLNTDLPSSLFTFKVPRGVDVIRN